MRKNLLSSVLCVLSVSFALCVMARPVQAGGPSSATTQTNPAEHWKIEVENWAKPQAGWLYVLDPKPQAGGAGGRVWLVDPETAKVMGSIRTGDGADFALSPDGSRLYVASVTKEN